MKGFIEVKRSGNPILLSVSTIARVSPDSSTTRIEFIAMNPSGSLEKTFVDESYDEVVAMIRQAQE